MSAAALPSLLARYLRVLRASWAARGQLATRPRTPLERQFLPAALEILETPAPALPRAVVWTIVLALAFSIAWATIGRIDEVAVAAGKVIAADKTKIIQPAETGVVKRILVADGQRVKAGQVLIELEAAATATAADTARTREALMAARLEAARYDALAHAARGIATAPSLAAPKGATRTLIDAETRAMVSQYQEQRAKLAALDAEIAKRTAEALLGSIAMSSAPGRGTTVRLTLPLTLAIIDGMLVRVGDQRFIIPALAIVRSQRIAAEDVTAVLGRSELLASPQGLVPLIRLRQLFAVDGPGRENGHHDDLVTIVSAADGSSLTGLVVSELLGQHQIVMKSLGDGVGDVRGISGAAILSDGTVGLVIDVQQTVRLAHGGKE
jgi:multidrug efflux pump subunit AcrA (membrane-fusion protein)